MKELKTSEVLDLAADAIQMAGWRQGPLGWDGYDGLCLEGALYTVVGKAQSANHCPAGRAVRSYLDMASYEPGVNGLWEWNDVEGRTEQEVIEVLRAAAAVERAKEAVAIGPVYETEDQPLPLDAA